MSEQQGWLPYDPDPKALDSLLDQVDHDVEGWRPEPGDKLAGTVVDISVGTSEYGEYPLITVQTSAGLVGVHCFHEVLRREISRKVESNRLKVGDLIAVAYRGEGQPKGGNHAPNMYRVAIKPAP